MLLVSSWLGALLSPPGCALVALVVALALRRRYPRAAWTVVLLATLGLYACSARPVADSLLRPLEDGYAVSQAAPEGCDAIVVLGSGALDLPAATWPEAKLDDGSLRRTLAALRVWRAQPRPLVLMGGRRFPDDPPGQAQYRAQLLRALGVPADQMRLLEAGRTTYGEAQAVAGLAREAHWQRVCLVTSAWHLPRAVATFRHTGLRVVPVPCDFRVDDRRETLRSWLPSVGALRISATALHEYLGLLYYRLRYGVHLQPSG